MPRPLTLAAIVLAFAVTTGGPTASEAASTTVIENSHAVRDSGVVPASLEPRGIGSGTIWYVAPWGSDSWNDGRSAGRPFRSLQRAADLLGPGDVVSLASGRHVNPDPRDVVMEIRRSGTPDRWITVRPQPGQKPVIHVRNWAGIRVRDASYVLIEGLTVRGNLYETSYAEAWRQRFNLANPLTTGSGILVEPDDRDSRIPHHVVIRDNTVLEVPGTGIGARQADYVLIQGNTVHHTSWWSPFAPSGIGIWESKNFDWSTGYKMFVLDNTVHDVDNKVPFVFAGRVTDGHGLVVDQTQSTARFRSRSPYVGKTLIAGNDVYDVGGRGVSVIESRNVDILGNRLYRTSQNASHQPRATIDLGRAFNVLIKGNGMDNPRPYIWQSGNVTADVDAPGVSAKAR